MRVADPVGHDTAGAFEEARTLEKLVPGRHRPRSSDLVDIQRLASAAIEDMTSRFYQTDSTDLIRWDHRCDGGNHESRMNTASCSHLDGYITSELRVARANASPMPPAQIDSATRYGPT